MKMAEEKEQFFVPLVPIFVPVGKAGSAGSSGVEVGDAIFYGCISETERALSSRSCL
jgi:hypothetical protein